MQLENVFRCNGGNVTGRDYARAVRDAKPLFWLPKLSITGSPRRKRIVSAAFSANDAF